MARVETFQPSNLAASKTFSQVVVASGSRIVFTSGQVSVDSNGTLIAPGDLAGQTAQAMRNVIAALAAANASFADVVKTTTFVVGFEPDQREVITDAKMPFYEGRIPPASALIGVSALAQPGWLIEIEAVAVLD